ncbi:MAG TPA: hypothetical protein VFU29_24945 [Chitinophagaceae bacterium]|nr:hypothetical protein [Chitinophagaceae bacterium]
MDTQTLTLILSTFAVLLSLLTFYLLYSKQDTRKNADPGFTTRPLQLQAYERLVILTERVALPNIVSRANQPGITAKEMQLLMLESIKQEFEYNSSQQIYVSPVAWQAVNNLKEQNMLIINQIAQTLPADARGYDLGKRIMEVIIAQDKKALHNIVLEALNYEARKLMK